MDYIAFISYRHKPLDKSIAKKLHTSIEHYKVPRELRKEKQERRLGKVFRDEEELPASGSLSDSILYALDHSEFLIVVCTPDTPESMWVRREISYFIERHGRDHVITVLCEGTPEASFPDELTQENTGDVDAPIREVEPLAANLTDMKHRMDRKRYHREIVRLYAAMLGCSYDTLWQRERRYRARRTMAVMAFVLVLALAFSAFLLQKNREITERNMQIEEQNIQIVEQNEEIQEQNAELRLKEADALMRESELLLEKGNTYEAANRALEAISTEEGMAVYAADAEYLLSRALGAGQYKNRMRTVNVVEQESEIRELKLSGNGELLFTRDTRNLIRCFSTRTGELLWRADSLGGEYYETYQVPRKDRMILLEQQELLLCRHETGLTALSINTGDFLWHHSYEEEEFSGRCVDFAFLNEEQTMIAVIDCAAAQVYSDEIFYHTVNQYELVFLDPETGNELQRIAFPEQFEQRQIHSYGDHNGIFISNDRYFACALYSETFIGSGNRKNEMHYLLVDLQSNEVFSCVTRELEVEYISDPPYILGLSYFDDGKYFLSLHYDIDSNEVKVEQLNMQGDYVYLFSYPYSRSTLRQNDDWFFSGFECDEFGRIRAFCNDSAYDVRKEDTHFQAGNKSYGKRVLGTNWMSAENDYLTLTDDGCAYTVIEHGPLSYGPFFDQQHLSILDITDGFARTDENKEGAILNENAVAAVVKDENMRKAYILKPAQDDHVVMPEWGAGLKNSNTSSIQMIQDHIMVFFGKEDGAESDTKWIRIIDVDSDTIKAEYQIDAETEERINLKYAGDPVFWDDEEHFSFCGKHSEKNTFYVCSMSDMECKKMFGYEKVVGASCSKQRRGGVLHAQIVSTTGDRYDETANRIVYRKNMENAVEIAPDTEYILGDGKSDTAKPCLIAGENGYLIANLYERRDSEYVSGFYACNTEKNEGYVIEDTERGTYERKVAVGNDTPVFAVTDSDRKVRIYHILRGKIIAEIDSPAEWNNVENIYFCSDDQAILIWTKDRRILLMDVNTGEVLFDEYPIVSTIENGEINMTVTEDPEEHRMFLLFSSGRGLCLNTEYCAITEDLAFADAVSPTRKEIFYLEGGLGSADGRSGILRYPAYTLEDLIEWGKED